MTKSGTTLTVTGVDYGKTTLSITSSSGKKRDIPVNIYNHRFIETDELIITFLQTLEWRFCRHDGKPWIYHPVDYTAIVCVREDLTIKGTIADNFIVRASDTYTTTWPFTNTRVWAIWNIEGPVAEFHENAYLHPGTFVAVNSGDNSNPRAPSDHPVMNVLKAKLPMLTEETPFEHYVPRLTGRQTPPDETSPIMAREMLVPASTISDPYYVALGKEDKRIADSPFYRLERHVFWKKVQSINNTSDIEQGGGYKIIHGIETSESEKKWEETGIEISAEAGVSIKGVDAKVTSTISRSLGYETMTGISRLEHSERTIVGSLWMLPVKNINRYLHAVWVVLIAVHKTFSSSVSIGQK